MTTRMTISMLRMAAAAILLRAHLASALRMASRSDSRSAAVVVDSHPAGAVRGDNNMKNERNHSGGNTRKQRQIRSISWTTFGGGRKEELRTETEFEEVLCQGDWLGLRRDGSLSVGRLELGVARELAFVKCGICVNGCWERVRVCGRQRGVLWGR